MVIKTQLANFAAARKAEFDQWYRNNVERSKGDKLFNAENIILNGTQSKIVTDLNHKGISVIHIDEFFPDREWWKILSGEAEIFVSNDEVQRYIHKYKNNEDTSGSISDLYAKKYLYRKYNLDRKNELIDLNDPFLQFALDEKILNVVSSYLHTSCRLRMIDLWYNIARGLEPPILSQKWHRDGEDIRLVKVFLYFNDVNTEGGPFTYVKDSHYEGKYGKLWPAKTVIDNIYGGVYPETQEVEEQVDSDDVVSCIGKAGTMIFCDTYGLHRGGHCISNDRLMGNWVYTTPSSFCGNVTRYKKVKSNLSDIQKFALSF